MKPGARLQAAIEVVEQVLTHHQPASEALSEWGRTHRFAGSGDRAAIGNLVYDVMRRKLSLAARMDADTARALVLAAAPRAFAMAPEAVAALADGTQHTPSPLSETELANLTRTLPPETPAHILADVPAWLAPSLQRVLGPRFVAEGEALARRAPVDLRANRLKADRNRVLKALAPFHPAPTPWVADGVRLAAPDGPGRQPNVEADSAHGKGWFEVQDEGSQIAALLARAGPRLQVLDLCAGAGGKTLAMAAQMQNTGQIYAYDRDKHQLRPIFERLKRAGVRNVQVMDAGNDEALHALGPRFDIVFIDAPCTGSGTWRRRPDAKWRLKEHAFGERQREQRAVLDLARTFVKPGGRMVYVTCSLLPEENGDQVASFLDRAAEFSVLPFAEQWREALGGEPPSSADGGTGSLLLTPASHGTDGFFITVMRRQV